MNEVMDGQESLFGPDIPSTRMSPEHSPQTKEKTGGASSKRSAASKIRLPMSLDLRTVNGKRAEASWVTGILSHGRLRTLNSGELRRDADGLLWLPITADTQQPTFFLTLNIGERPRTPNPTKLSQILERNPDPKYSLSARACPGILNRAARRGKELPPQLRLALEAQAAQAD